MSVNDKEREMIKALLESGNKPQEGWNLKIVPTGSAKKVKKERTPLDMTGVKISIPTSKKPKLAPLDKEEKLYQISLIGVPFTVLKRIDLIAAAEGMSRQVWLQRFLIDVATNRAKKIKVDDMLYDTSATTRQETTIICIRYLPQAVRETLKEQAYAENVSRNTYILERLAQASMEVPFEGQPHRANILMARGVPRGDTTKDSPFLQITMSSPRNITVEEHGLTSEQKDFLREIHMYLRDGTTTLEQSVKELSLVFAEVITTYSPEFASGLHS